MPRRAHGGLQPARPPTRVGELRRKEPLLGRGGGVYSRRAMSAAANRVRGAMPEPGRVGGLSPRPLSPRPAPLLRPWAARAHPRVAFLPLRGPRMRRAPASDFRARLRLLRTPAGTALLPRALGCLRAQRGLQVHVGRGGARERAGRWVRGGATVCSPPSHRLAGLASWPTKLPARPPPAPPTAACWARDPAACVRTQASWVHTAGIWARVGAL